MKRSYCYMTFLFFLFFVCNLPAEPLPPLYKFYPLPLSELEGIVMPWLKTSGFEVSSLPHNMGQIILSANREGTNLKILLKPHSPLASEIWIKKNSGWEIDDNQFDELWDHLNAYIDTIVSNSEIPAEMVPTRIKSLDPIVVCIKANLNDDEVQISGFFIDKQGLIISTAHDITELHKIKVMLWDGQEFEAILVKTNPDKDLALLHISYKPNSYISLLKGRETYKPNEILYSISCLNNRTETIHSGTIIDPPVNVEDQLLWKINMKTFHGSSGSPVIDEKGNLVGIVKGRYRGSDSIGFLIPFETIIEFLNNI